MQRNQRAQKQATASASHQKASQENDFQLERYKYILDEIRTLNENIYKYLTLFQTLAVAIIGGGIGIFVIWKSLHIDAGTARVAILGSLGLLGFLDMFITITIVANIFSWFDYRKEEVELLEKVVGHGSRNLPTFRNFWRWSETYILLFINIVVIAVCFYVEYQVIPLVK